MTDDSEQTEKQSSLFQIVAWHKADFWNKRKISNSGGTCLVSDFITPASKFDYFSLLNTANSMLRRIDGFVRF